MENFEFQIPKVIFGVDEIENIGKYTSIFGKKALLVSGKKAMKKLGILDKVKYQLKKEKIEVIEFSGIESNPRVETVDKAVEMIRRNPVDFVIALGGGSVMDSAKFIVAAGCNGGSSWDYCVYKDRPPRNILKAIPIVTVPTLAATGSEVNDVGVITNWKTHEKSVMSHPLLLPKLAILDPKLTISVNKDYTADGGIDILCHLLEPYITGNDESETPDRLTESLISVVLDVLPKLLNDLTNVKLRGEILWTSSLALCGLTSAGRDGPFPMHQIQHALSGHYDISHGRGLAILLPRYLEVMSKVVPNRIKKLGRIFNANSVEECLNKLVAWLKKVYIETKITKSLTLIECGINEEKFDIMAEDTIRIYGHGKNFLDTPKKFYKNDIVSLYKKCNTKL
jgi:alcohol dehydrogenase YqhD (iron-dependent ADH family)